MTTNQPGTYAECPDCQGHLYVSGNGYACDMHPDAHLAVQDVYLEHDERQATRPDDTGRSALYVYTLPQCVECGDAVESDDPHAGYGMCATCLHDALRSGWTPANTHG